MIRPRNQIQAHYLILFCWKEEESRETVTESLTESEVAEHRIEYNNNITFY